MLLMRSVKKVQRKLGRGALVALLFAAYAGCTSADALPPSSRYARASGGSGGDSAASGAAGAAGKRGGQSKGGGGARSEEVDGGEAGHTDAGAGGAAANTGEDGGLAGVAGAESGGSSGSSGSGGSTGSSGSGNSSGDSGKGGSEAGGGVPGGSGAGAGGVEPESGGEGGEGGRTTRPGCPDFDVTVATETDHDADGWADDCDDDDDDDGLLDIKDVSPLDPTLPGDTPSNSPGYVLTHPCMVQALHAIEARGFSIPVRRQRGAIAPLDGYYVRPELSGAILATSDDRNVGKVLTRIESRRRYLYDDKYQLDAVEVYAGVPTYSHGADAVRGRDDELTGFGSGDGTLLLVAFRREPGGRRWSDVVVLFVTAPEPEAGSRIESCPEGWGTWVLSAQPGWQRVEADELDYMCADGEAAYLPDESWTDANERTCVCSHDYEVVCGP